MEKIKIITDSTCDLPKYILEELDIEVVPLTVNVNFKSYRDNVDITFEEVSELISKTEDFPTISQITPDVFREVYQKYLDNGYKIISIHISNKLSETYQHASIAKDILDTDDIIVYDSLNVSGGLGILVYEAARMVKRGCMLKEICDNIEKSIPSILSCIFMEELTTLTRFGKISDTLGAVGNFLGIKPIISVVDGELVLVGKFISNKKGLNYIINFIKSANLDKPDNIFVIQEGGFKLFDDVKKYLGDNGYKYLSSNVGCVVGVYTGNKGGSIYLRKSFRREGSYDL